TLSSVLKPNARCSRDSNGRSGSGSSGGALGARENAPPDLGGAPDPPRFGRGFGIVTSCPSREAIGTVLSNSTGVPGTALVPSGPLAQNTGPSDLPIIWGIPLLTGPSPAGGLAPWNRRDRFGRGLSGIFWVGTPSETSSSASVKL